MCTDEESQLKVPASKGLPKLTHRVAGACNKLTQSANDILDGILVQVQMV